MHDVPDPDSPPRTAGDLDALADRLQRIHFSPRASLEAEILRALRRNPAPLLPAFQPAGTPLGLGIGAALTGLLLFLLWHALLQASR